MSETKEDIIKVTETVDGKPVKKGKAVSQPPAEKLPEVPEVIGEAYLARTISVLGKNNKAIHSLINQGNLLGALNALIFSNKGLGESKQLPVGCGAEAVRDMLAVLVEDYNAKRK